MSDGVILIKKLGLIWEVTINVPGFGAGLKCKPGWKNRRGMKGAGESLIEGKLDEKTEDLLDKFIEEIPAISYVHVLSRKSMKVVFDRHIHVNQVQSQLAALIKTECGLTEIRVKDNNTSEQQGTLIRMHAHRRR